MLSSPLAKNIMLPFFGKVCFIRAIPPCQEGRLAIVTNVGRDAVDATERETSAAVADGEAVWFWRPEAGVKFARTPTRRADDGVNKAVVPGESAE